MKPLIGISVNHSFNDSIGIISSLGFKGQDWQLIASDYIKSVELSGGCPVIIPIVDNIDTIWDFVKTLDGIIFTGGSDIDPCYFNETPVSGLGTVNPLRDQHEIELCRRILNQTKIPVLGICKGLQLINVVAGGTLYQDLKTQKLDSFCHSLSNFPRYYSSHKVKIKENSRLRNIFKTDSLGVNSFHHQAVKDLGENFTATMESEDGVIEGIEMESDRFVVAVQWHPEAMVEKDNSYLNLFTSFIKACKDAK